MGLTAEAVRTLERIAAARGLTLPSEEHINNRAPRLLELLGGSSARTDLSYNDRVLAGLKAVAGPGATTVADGWNNAVSSYLAQSQDTQGVTAWKLIDWTDAAIQKADPTSADNGSSVANGNLTIRHKSQTTSLTTDGSQRTGIGWLFPVTIPGGKNLNWRRHKVIIRGRVNFGNGAVPVGATGWLMMMAHASPLFPNGFNYSAAGRRQAASSVINNALRSDNIAEISIGDGDFSYMMLTADECIVAAPTRSRNRVAYATTGFGVSALDSGVRTIDNTSSEVWGADPGGNLSKVWLGCWVTTNNVAPGAAFAMTFEQVAYRIIDLFPEEA